MWWLCPHAPSKDAVLASCLRSVVLKNPFNAHAQVHGFLYAFVVGDEFNEGCKVVFPDPRAYAFQLRRAFYGDWF